MSKSGAPADDSLDEEKQWIFFVRLLFLKDTMTGRPTSGNLKPVAEDDVHSAGGTGHNESAQQIFEEMYQDEELSVEEAKHSSTCRPLSPSAVGQKVVEDADCLHNTVRILILQVYLPLVDAPTRNKNPEGVVYASSET
ncbi:hypothetical protein HPB49_009590 [Dermacentor silvarum]|uniref:Uncharacterized protein n=1 Tax=Dermacentor silvarum TaxID=543639 RepID=A0ACB8D448_DERSI|nr:hypothetical protein HPB49_009590 [Dermacentor silvarum]